MVVKVNTFFVPPPDPLNMQGMTGVEVQEVLLGALDVLKYMQASPKTLGRAEHIVRHVLGSWRGGPGWWQPCASFVQEALVVAPVPTVLAGVAITVEQENGLVQASCVIEGLMIAAKAPHELEVLVRLADVVAAQMEGKKYAR